MRIRIEIKARGLLRGTIDLLVASYVSRDGRSRGTGLGAKETCRSLSYDSPTSIRVSKPYEPLGLRSEKRQAMHRALGGFFEVVLTNS